MAEEAHNRPLSASWDQQDALTRFAFVLMDRRRTITELHHITAIPLPTLSMYSNGHRSISHYHRPILAIALDVPISAILGYCTTEVIVMETPDPPPQPDPDEEPSHPPEVPDGA